MLLAVCGAVAVAVRWSGEPGTPAGSPSAPVRDGSATTVPSDPLDDMNAGDCLRNDGTDTSPVMVSSACAGGSLRVLSRNSGTVDENICPYVGGTRLVYVMRKYELITEKGVEVSRTLSVPESYVFCLQRL